MAEINNSQTWSNISGKTYPICSVQDREFKYIMNLASDPQRATLKEPLKIALEEWMNGQWDLGMESEGTVPIR